MSYQAVLDDDEAIQVASNSGWHAFAKWVDTLDSGDYPELAHLAQHGWEQDLGDLADQIAAALAGDAPDDDVADVAHGLLMFLDEHEEAGAIVITQGIGDDGEVEGAGRSYAAGLGESRSVEVPGRPPHRLGAGRVHKAGSAESILRHCLRSLGLSGAWRGGGLTGEQALELLAAIRDYGRAWLHHEAMQLIRHHGRKVDDPLGMAIAGRCVGPGLGMGLGLHAGDAQLRGGDDARDGSPESSRAQGTAADALPASSPAELYHEAMQLVKVHGRKIDGGGTAIAGREHAGHSQGNGDAAGAARIADGLDRGGDRGMGDAPGCGAVYSEGHPGELVVRALGAAMRHHVGRFFDRARGFVRELILAGAMALNGPGGLTADDLAEADRATEAQVAYLERFRHDLRLNPPPELADQSAPLVEGAMTAAQFAARAELYGASVWSAAQDIARKGVIRVGGATHERRVHVGSDVPCRQCRDEVAKGAVPIGTLKAIGDCTCLNQCHCHFEVLGADGKWRWIGGRAA